jgi:hypothetical protein
LAWMRLTLVKPLPGNEPEALRVLKELDESIGPAPGLLFSIVLSRSAPRAGRISLWRSKGDAERETTSDRALALRSRLHTLSADTDESELEVEPGRLTEVLTASLATGKKSRPWHKRRSGRARQPPHAPFAKRQSRLRPRAAPCFLRRNPALYHIPVGCPGLAGSTRSFNPV